MKVLLASVLLLAGCGGSAAGGASSPSPNLGAEYLRIVAPLNVAADELTAAVKAQPQDNPRIRKAAADNKAAEGKFITDLLRLRSEAPANVRPDIDALRRNIAASEALMGTIATATDANIASAVLAAENAPDNGEAALVRSDLGLAPPPGSAVSPTP